jgi:cobalamin biosynthesis protein CobW
MNGPIPATIITGFLGAGKTTLIQNLIAKAGGRRIALIVNEFGDLGFDGEQIAGCGIEGCADDDVIELTNGCICCTVADDFLPTMEMLLAREPAPDHIVIETSGLALPQPLVQAFNWPSVAARTTVDGVMPWPMPKRWPMAFTRPIPTRWPPSAPPMTASTMKRRLRNCSRISCAAPI